MRARIIIALMALGALLLTACGSGPTEAVLAAGRIPATTTTTEAPPEGVVVVTITNGSFRPSNLKLDLNEQWIVEWQHEDTDDREYVLEGRNGEFISPTLVNGDVYQWDLSELEPGIYRYFTWLGQQRVPGSIDTRPDQ